MNWPHLGRGDHGYQGLDASRWGRAGVCQEDPHAGVDPPTRPGPPARPTRSAGRTTNGPAILPVLQELPAPPTVFTGRANEFHQLSRLLDPTRAGRPVIVAFYGAGGIGKFALALPLGPPGPRAVRRRQLYVNLHGATPSHPFRRAASTALAVSRSGGSPQMVLPVIRMAPKPSPTPERTSPL